MVIISWIDARHHYIGYKYMVLNKLVSQVLIH
uniref:Uncharacterized protein n=1 Tax=Anguilla anguilla TaxID=7936 RepID=A0A0E9QFE8_ANGAN